MIKKSWKKKPTINIETATDKNDNRPRLRMLKGIVNAETIGFTTIITSVRKRPNSRNVFIPPETLSPSKIIEVMYAENAYVIVFWRSAFTMLL